MIRAWTAALVLLLAAPAAAQETYFVGAGRCRSCHTKAYDVWLTSGHARAGESLTGERSGELRCLFCHATDAQANLATFRFRNVECEACHGPGARHISLALAESREKGKPVGGLEAVNEGRCRSCHSLLRSPNLRPFRYDLALQKIRHW